MVVLTIRTFMPGDSLILTSNGYQQLCELSNNQARVWNGVNWEQRSANAVSKVGTCIVIEMTTGISIRCTADHILAIKDGNAIVPISAGRLMPGNECVLWKCIPVVHSNFYKIGNVSNDDPPVNCNVHIQLAWLCSHVDKDAGCLQITSDNKPWLLTIQRMAHCLGTSPFIVKSPRGFHLRFCSMDVRFLINTLKMSGDKKISDFCWVDQVSQKIAFIRIEYGVFDIYTLV